MNRILLFTMLCFWVGNPFQASGDENDFIFEGAPNIIAAEQLDLFHFQSRVREGAEENPENYEDYQIDLHMPKRSHVVGEPVYAYFLVKNNQSEERLGINLRLDLHQGDVLVNGCDIDLVQLEGEPAEVLQSRVHVCGSGPILSIPKAGYYCIRADLRQHGALNPGRYQISWSTSFLLSREIEFTIEPSLIEPNEGDIERGKAIAPRAYPSLRIARIERVPAEREEPQARPIDAPSPPIEFGSTWLRPEHDGHFAAALASGVGGNYYGDIHDLPSKDADVEASAQFIMQDDEGAIPTHVRLTLQPGMQIMDIGENNRLFIEKEDIHIFILASSDSEGADKLSEVFDPSQEQEMHRFIEGYTTWYWMDDPNNPLQIDIELPEDWPELLGLSGQSQIRFIICSEEVEMTYSHWHIERQELEEIAPRHFPWEGLLCTPPLEIEIALP